ncbi:MAG: 5-oxoprolinase subunit PxpA [Flavobacteriaceae bacterium]
MENNTRAIDINCDVGEGLGNEAQLFPFISSCSIACGGHAGNRETMLEVVRLAIMNKVRIGAHPSYPDRENFGRKSIRLSAPKLIRSITEQIEILASILISSQQKLFHIKPHGALYNDIARDRDLATTFLRAVNDYREDVWLYVPPGSAIGEEALKNRFSIKYEAFADRNYNRDLSLVSREHGDAVITDPKLVLEHLLSMVLQHQVKSTEGSKIDIKADTYCIHGDNPQVLQILMYLSYRLPNHNIQIDK